MHEEVGGKNALHWDGVFQCQCGGVVAAQRQWGHCPQFVALVYEAAVVEGIVWVKYLDGYVKFVCLWIIYGKVVHHVQKNLSVFVLEYLDAVFIGEVQWDILEIIFVCV